MITDKFCKTNRKRQEMKFVSDVVQIYIERGPWFLELLGDQLAISLTAIVLSAVIGLGLGVFIAEHRRFAEPVMAVCNVFYTIPAIALIGLLIPLVGIGEKNAIIAIVLYGIMPMVRNTRWMPTVSAMPEAVPARAVPMPKERP